MIQKLYLKNEMYLEEALIPLSSNFQFDFFHFMIYPLNLNNSK